MDKTIKSIAFVPIGTSIDLTDDLAEYSIKVDDSDLTGIQVIFECPEKLYKEGRHPNQWFMEELYGKPE